MSIILIFLKYVFALLNYWLKILIIPITFWVSVAALNIPLELFYFRGNIAFLNYSV